MASVQYYRSLDGLPRQFVCAMRTLFDIMDNKKTGYVRFTDIESRWQEGATKGLPRGVIESLRKVTPTNGLLTFERFCAGLKICLLRHRTLQVHENRSVRRRNCPRLSPAKIPHRPVPGTGSSLSNRPSSVPLPERIDPKTNCQPQATVSRPGSATARLGTSPLGVHPRAGRVNTATVRPNNALSHQRAISMPHLQSENLSVPRSVYRENMHGLRSYKSDLNPGNRFSPVTQPSFPSHRVDERPVVSSASNRLGILTALENWRMGILMNNDSAKASNLTSRTSAPSDRSSRLVELNRMPARVPFKGPDGRSVSEPHGLGYSGVASDGDIAGRPDTGPSARKALHRRREPRRHTLANGIDFAMLKHMKQMEQERDMLQQGLEVVDKARDWYFHQINGVHEKMRFVGKSTLNSEYATDSYQERLNLQMAKILEVNQNLSSLMDSSDKSYPLHMNLAFYKHPVASRLQHDSTQLLIQRLREQNRMLTEEVSKKSEVITQLEKEKSVLIRELFQSRVNQRESDGMGFM